VAVVEMVVPQQMRALARANAVRDARVKVKREVKEGTTRVADVLLDPPEPILGMELFELLTAQRRWGRVRTLRSLAAARLRENKKVGEMTERQRRELAGLVSW
jgi:hypothetical protein